METLCALVPSLCVNNTYQAAPTSCHTRPGRNVSGSWEATSCYLREPESCQESQPRCGGRCSSELTHPWQWQDLLKILRPAHKLLFILYSLIYKKCSASFNWTPYYTNRVQSDMARYSCKGIKYPTMWSTGYLGTSAVKYCRIRYKRIKTPIDGHSVHNLYSAVVAYLI